MNRRAGLAAAALAAPIAVAIVARWYLGAVRVVGRSMQPTMNEHDLVLYRRRWVRPRSGAAVILATAALDRLVPAAAGSAARSPRLMVKRVVAVAGDPVPAEMPCDCREVCAGRVMVRGDADVSLDSRTWGCVPIEVVAGVAIGQHRAPRSTMRNGRE
jgi:signal peptidase I